MKERPLPLKDFEVRAILEGRKTQTRRIVKPQPSSECRAAEMSREFPANANFIGGRAVFKCPYGVPGDRLWVRESIAVCSTTYDQIKRGEMDADLLHTWHLADGLKRSWCDKTITARFMPRWASRITLEVTDVRVQQVQEISEADAKAEGAFFTDYGRRCFHMGGPPSDVGMCAAPLETHPQREGWSMVPTTSSDRCLHTAQSAFANLWDSINAKRGFGWDKNPWVWAITFRRL